MVDKKVIIGTWKNVPLTLSSLSEVYFDYFREVGLQNNIVIDPTVKEMKSLISKKERKSAEVSKEVFNLSENMNIIELTDLLGSRAN